jgi:heme-degrading monooxygenase HmoA
MILEVANLHIKRGECATFEAAFAQAAPIIASMRGYVSHQIQRCIEDDHHYVLLVNWQTLEDHTVGFRESAEYQQWRALLHHFYEPFPAVLHFAALAG